MGSPVGPYFPGGFQPLKFFTDEENERGGPLSAASYKLATNYGPTISSSAKGEKRGYNQVLWMGSNEDIHETGASNVFFVFRRPGNQLEVVTPPLDGSVLPGVTRDSVLQLLRENEELIVSERRIKKDELLQAMAEEKVRLSLNQVKLDLFLSLLCSSFPSSLVSLGYFAFSSFVFQSIS